MNVFISTLPFGEIDKGPLELLVEVGAKVLVNPTGRKLRDGEIDAFLGDTDILIAGTENLDAASLSQASRLKQISRVGIGVDSVDLNAARTLGIEVTNTPDGPTEAVIDLAIGLMVSLLRRVPEADRCIRNGQWDRLMGRRLGTCTVGVIGVGRIGGGLIRHLRRAYPGIYILANDPEPKPEFENLSDVEWVAKSEILERADVVTLHVPLTDLTRNMIDGAALAKLRPDAVLINLARGGIIDEQALYECLKAGEIQAAAIDVFTKEPYRGALAELGNCLLTAHQGPLSEDCRALMERQAVEEAVRFIRGERRHNVVVPGRRAEP